jgi:hypothetical protein
MALITCTECQAEISDKAEACPKCGNPMAAKVAPPRKKEASLGRKVLRTSAGLIVGVLALGFWVSHETQNAGTSESSVTSTQPDAVAAANNAPSEPPIKISASDLYASYHANEVAADGKYKGRILEVRGIVTTIGKDVLDNPYVSLAGSDNEFESVNAYFGKDKADELAKLSKGESISVTCRGNGMSIGSPVLDCKG